MTDLYDSQQHPLRLGKRIGGGGEADIYLVDGEPTRVAKCYKPGPRRGYNRKLAWMIAHPPDDPTRASGHISIAWPTDLLYSRKGRLVGYLMPYIKNTVSVLKVYNPRERARTLPAFNWRYLHRTARNLAAAIHTLHRHDYVVGDLNESNVLVTPTALVTLIDTDSFQVIEQQSPQLIVYPCPVGKPEYTPPELQGVSFQQVLRKPEHDNFSLGVLIFQLLMDGNHPFRGRWRGRGDPPTIEDKIRQGWFPYSTPSGYPIAPPPNIPSLDRLHPRIAALMQRCFVDGHKDLRQRPTAKEWEQALEEAEHTLVECTNGHVYAGHLSKCPHCGMGRKVQGVSRQSSRLAPKLPYRSPPPGPMPGTPQTNPLSAAAPSAPTSAPPIQTVTCPTCGANQPTGTRWCMRCGAPFVAITCPACRTVNPPGNVYCQNCGRQLTPDRTCPYCKQGTAQGLRFCIHCGQPVI